MPGRKLLHAELHDDKRKKPVKNPNPDPAKHKEITIWDDENWLYEDFEVGKRARSIRRTISEGESMLFNAIVLDMHPYVADQMFAEHEGIFGKRLVAGAFVFHVKQASPSGQCKHVFGEKTPGTIDALFKFARALDFALILLVVGGAAMLAYVLRSAASELRARLHFILTGLALGVVVAAALCIVLQGAVAGGFGLTEAFRSVRGYN